MNSQPYMFPNGLYVLGKGKEETLAKLGELLPEFMRELNDRSAVLKCKEMSSRLKNFLREYFLPDTHGTERSIQIISQMHSDSITQARIDGQWMLGFLLNLKSVVSNSFKQDELPSCRSLLNDSAETAAKKAVDLIGNNVISGIARSLFMGKDIHDLCSISDIKRFYQDGLDEFSKEKEAGWTLSQQEQLLECKFQVESRYCDMAALHVAGKLTKEIYESGKLWIEEQEHRIGLNNNALSLPSGMSIEQG